MFSIHKEKKSWLNWSFSMLLKKLCGLQIQEYLVDLDARSKWAMTLAKCHQREC
jgi:hypothetical protein